MKTMLISVFKDKAIQCIKEVQQSKDPLQITLRGTPLAVIHPADPLPARKVILGSGAKYMKPDHTEPDWFDDTFAKEWEGGLEPAP